jgi:integrase
LEVKEVRSKWIQQTEMDVLLRLLTPANRLVIRVSILTGLRVGDVVALRTAQLDKERFTVTEQKTGRRRMIRLPVRLRRELAAQAGPYWVFQGRLDTAKHRTRQAVWKDVKRASRALRMGKGVSPHTARKCYAVSLLEASGGDMDKVRAALGHEGVTTTMLYALANKL